MKKLMKLMIILLLFTFSIKAQQVTLTPEQIKGLTPEWKGERFPDGRPKVSDKMLERLKKVHLEKHGEFFEIKDIKINSRGTGISSSLIL
jgi:hypothetical protein